MFTEPSNQNNGDNRNDLFKQTRERVKLKQVKEAAVAKPDGINGALLNKVNSKITDSLVIEAIKEKAMNDLQCSFHNDFSLSS